jgi:hypothetical protein
MAKTTVQLRAVKMHDPAMNSRYHTKTWNASLPGKRLDRCGQTASERSDLAGEVFDFPVRRRETPFWGLTPSQQSVLIYSVSNLPRIVPSCFCSASGIGSG